MKFLRLYTTNPYFNLAVEEYMLSKTQEEIFIIWQNEPTVVIGKNQNVYAEINHEYLKKNNIKIARRITGGGAVYHDLGNVNYTFIGRARESGIDFAYFSSPIIDALRELGVDAQLSGRNDITVSGRKVSGNAQCTRDGMVLHHGTLLFDSDLTVLSSVLNVDQEKLRSKALKSTRSRVANIKEFISEEMTVKDFIDYLCTYINRSFSPECIEVPSGAEIDSLVSRNSSEEWIFPDRSFLSDYDLFFKKRFSIGSLELNFRMKNELIQSVSVGGDFFGSEDLSVFCESFVGHTIDEIRSGGVDIVGVELIFGLTREMIIELLSEKADK